MNTTPLSRFVIILIASTASALSQNLLSNGNFEQGNTGFFSGYPYSAASDPGGANYSVVSNPHSWNSGGFSMNDHTSGSGLMLVADGSSLTSDIVWREVISVNANKSYLFSGWDASWGTFGGNPALNPATLQMSINGIQLGTNNTPSQVGQWQQFGFQWSSGIATQASIEIHDLRTDFLGNDFALDDLSLTTVPEPSPTLLGAIGLSIVFFLRKGRGRARVNSQN